MQVGKRPPRVGPSLGLVRSSPAEGDSAGWLSVVESTAVMSEGSERTSCTSF